jgi:RNA polymerase sigma-70 factor (ECF subfamily)
LNDVTPRGEQSLNAVANGIDERLLIEAAQHDPSRFAELYETNFHRVYAYVARRVRDRAEAEDITAEVFHRALLKLAEYEWRGVPFAAWLLRIAANTLADRWQRMAREQTREVISDTSDEGHADALDPGVDDGVERHAMLFQLVDRLSTDQRTVIIRRFVEQRSVREIAQELGRSEAAIKQLQFRALQTLRQQMRTS